jgi:hypothetical protein
VVVDEWLGDRLSLAAQGGVSSAPSDVAGDRCQLPRRWGSAVNPDLWGKHRARVDVLALTRAAAKLDSAWTAMQIARIRIRKKLKPLFLPVYLRLIE